MARFDTAPPVPPKDERYVRMMSKSITNTPTSASKRKRDDDHLMASSDMEDVEMENGFTPRKVASNGYNSADQSDGVTKPERALRRRKGVNNLSSLNLRHQAEQDQNTDQTLYESKFQEGSLTDRPSQKPPSVFMRVTQQSGTLQQHDTLMNDYHNGTPQSVIDREQVTATPQLAETPSTIGSIFSRIGQTLAAIPSVQKFNKIWNETKEELTQKNLAELQKRARQKAEAEARYEEMKRAGLIPNKKARGSTSARDSGVEMLEEHNLSALSSLAAPSTEGSIDHEDGVRTLRSRLSFIKKPSLNNLRFDLKRTRSEVDLAAARDSSSSISPVKTTFDTPIRKSPSKHDLRRQQKLTKKVSDLESKLQVAREQLGEALAQQAQTPRVSKQERYSSVKRSNRFVPGLLPSLPSERLLDPEMINSIGRDEDDNEQTIKASKPRAYPALSASLFNPQMTSAIPLETQGETEADNNQKKVGEVQDDEGTVDVFQQIAEEERDELAGDKDAYPTIETQLETGALSQDDHTPRKKRKINGSHTVNKPPISETKEIQDDTTDVDASMSYERVVAELQDDTRAPSRLSIDSTAHSLEPVYEEDYEEEDELIIVPVHEAPKNPTAQATPARFGRKPRTKSPSKRAASAKPGAEEVIMTKAAKAARHNPARQNPSRQARPDSKSFGEDYIWPDDVF